MVVKWFRDFALEKRIGHIVYCIDNNEWPVGKSYSAYTGCLGIDLDAPLYETIKRVILVEVEQRGGRSSTNTPDVITITTEHQSSPKSMADVATLRQQIQQPNLQQSLTIQTQQGNQQSAVTNANLLAVAAGALGTSTGTGKGKKGRRHIAIDVETERAKLHALLNSQNPPEFKTPKRSGSGKGATPQEILAAATSPGSKSIWDDVSEANIIDTRTRRSAAVAAQQAVAPTTAAPQPPPAHQHQSNRNPMQNYKSTVIPGTSSTLTPIDLSSG